MPITVCQIVGKVGLSTSDIRRVKWQELFNCRKEGVYIISLSKNPSINTTIKLAPISEDILELWVDKLGYFKLDGVRTCDVKIIKDRFSKFWLPDENILYIGKASLRGGKKGISNRVSEYYSTSFGKSRPHAGGHWIKMLANIDKLFVYYVECNNCALIEDKMLSIFGEHVSETTKDILYDKTVILPFANLEDGKRKRKKHGFSHMISK